MQSQEGVIQISSYDTQAVHAVLHLRKRNTKLLKLLAQITKSPSQDNPVQGKAPI